MTRDAFLQEIEAFLSAHAMHASRFGSLAVNDSGFVGRMRRGKDVRLSTMNKIRDFMARENLHRSTESAEQMRPVMRSRPRAHGDRRADVSA